MNFDEAIFATLRGLVDDRCYPCTFPQKDYAWPAIRYTVVALTPYPDQCGDGDEGDDGEGMTDDIRVQIDVIARTYDEMRLMRQRVRAEMKTIDPPAIQELSFQRYDPEVKGYMAILDYTLHPSSG